MHKMKIVCKQGCKFSDFSLIPDFFHILKIICKISPMEHVSYDFMVDSNFQKKFLYCFRLFH